MATFMDDIVTFTAQVPLLGNTGSPSRFVVSLVFRSNCDLRQVCVSIIDSYQQSRQCKARRVRVGVDINHHLHLLNIFFSSDMELKKGLTDFNVKPTFYADSILISPHWDQGLDSVAISSVPQGSLASSLNVRLRSAVIKFRWSSVKLAKGSTSSSETHRSSSAQKIRHWSASL